MANIRSMFYVHLIMHGISDGIWKQFTPEYGASLVRLLNLKHVSVQSVVDGIIIGIPSLSVSSVVIEELATNNDDAVDSEPREDHLSPPVQSGGDGSEAKKDVVDNSSDDQTINDDDTLSQLPSSNSDDINHASDVSMDVREGETTSVQSLPTSKVDNGSIADADSSDNSSDISSDVPSVPQQSLNYINSATVEYGDDTPKKRKLLRHIPMPPNMRGKVFLKFLVDEEPTPRVMGQFFRSFPITSLASVQAEHPNDRDVHEYICDKVKGGILRFKSNELDVLTLQMAQIGLSYKRKNCCSFIQLLSLIHCIPEKDCEELMEIHRRKQGIGTSDNINQMPRFEDIQINTAVHMFGYPIVVHRHNQDSLRYFLPEHEEAKSTHFVYHPGYNRFTTTNWVKTGKCAFQFDAASTVDLMLDADPKDLQSETEAVFDCLPSDRIFTNHPSISTEMVFVGGDGSDDVDNQNISDELDPSPIPTVSSLVDSEQYVAIDSVPRCIRQEPGVNEVDFHNLPSTTNFGLEHELSSVVSNTKGRRRTGSNTTMVRRRSDEEPPRKMSRKSDTKKTGSRKPRNLVKNTVCCFCNDDKQGNLTRHMRAHHPEQLAKRHCHNYGSKLKHTCPICWLTCARHMLCPHHKAAWCPRQDCPVKIVYSKKHDGCSKTFTVAPASQSKKPITYVNCQEEGCTVVLPRTVMRDHVLAHQICPQELRDKFSLILA